MLRCVLLCHRSVRFLACVGLCLISLLCALPARAGVRRPGMTFAVRGPSATIPIIAYASGPGVCDWIKITVDGVEYNATVTYEPNGYAGTINWDSSQAGNPSEHTASATAHFSYYGYPFVFSSTEPISQGGDGQPADFIIADLRLMSFQYVNAYTLRYQASADNPPTPDPAKVPSPQFVYDLNGNATTSGEPAGDIQAKTPLFKVRLHPLTGGATVGFTLQWAASPNTGDPALTLYDNTTTGSSPTALVGGAYNGSAQTALLSKVAKYGNSYSLRLWVKFTQTVSPAPYWYPVSSTYLFGNTLYAVLDTPKVPMAEPWVGVLDYACDWAKGTSAATTATTALTNGEWNNCFYNDGYFAYTDAPLKNASETFSLQGFLNNSPPTGQCNDFADFLVCLSNALGAILLQAQRSASANDYYIDPNAVPPVHNPACHFHTNLLVGAGGQYQTQRNTWTYHQWTTSNIFDGCLKFNGTDIPADMTLTNYYNQLVDKTLTPYLWNPQSPFMPTIAN